MRSENKIITPKWAAAVLASTNGHNRPIMNTVVKRYTNDMMNDRWLNDTGASIVFDVDGQLIDGQHRLMACVASGKSFRCTVTTEVAKEARHVLDTGKNISTRDLVYFAGGKTYGAKTTTILLTYLMLKDNKLRRPNYDTLLPYVDFVSKYVNRIVAEYGSSVLSTRGSVPSANVGIVFLFVCSKQMDRKAIMIERGLLTGENISGVTLKLRNDMIAKGKNHWFSRGSKIHEYLYTMHRIYHDDQAIPKRLQPSIVEKIKANAITFVEQNKTAEVI